MNKIPLLLAAACFVFIAVIVVLADQGRLPGFLADLYAFPNGDKLGHFLLMGGLSLLVNLALPASSGSRNSFSVKSGDSPRFLRKIKHVHILATLLVFALVALEEASQAWFGARHPDVADLAASLAGIVCLGWLGWRLRAAKRKTA